MNKICINNLAERGKDLEEVKRKAVDVNSLDCQLCLFG